MTGAVVGEGVGPGVVGAVVGNGLGPWVVGNGVGDSVGSDVLGDVVLGANDVGVVVVGAKLGVLDGDGLGSEVGEADGIVDVGLFVSRTQT